MQWILVLDNFVWNCTHIVHFNLSKSCPPFNRTFLSVSGVVETKRCGRHYQHNLIWAYLFFSSRKRGKKYDGFIYIIITMLTDPLLFERMEQDEVFRCHSLAGSSNRCSRDCCWSCRVFIAVLNIGFTVHVIVSFVIYKIYLHLLFKMRW